MASNLRMGVSGAPISAQIIAAGSFIDIDITGASAITEVQTLYRPRQPWPCLVRRR